MKKGILFIIMVTLTFYVFAKESVLIDFNNLCANGNGHDTSISLEQSDDIIERNVFDYEKLKLRHKTFEERSRKYTEHMPTLIDYSMIAGSNFSEEEKKVMAVSLSGYNWEIQLNSSSNSIENRGMSNCIEWHTKWVPVLDDYYMSLPETNFEERDLKKNKKAELETSGGFNILGVRIHYPEWTYNSWALIKPPFEIPAYLDQNVNYKGEIYEELYNNNSIGRDEYLESIEAGKKNKFSPDDTLGYGVVKNVDVIKYLDLRIYGCNFKNSVSILLKDQNEVISEYQMGEYLDFDGWKKIRWTNPNYIESAHNRPLYVVPLYPRSIPFVKFYAIRIYRQGDQHGGDFVTYVKDIKITYDEAIVELDRPIDHEDAWGILTEKYEAVKKREVSSLGHKQILKYLEKLKMHVDSDF